MNFSNANFTFLLKDRGDLTTIDELYFVERNVKEELPLNFVMI